MSGISDKEKWECYLCAEEFDFAQPAFGWLGNYQMLCITCADNIYFDPISKFHQALTFYYLIGDIQDSSNISSNLKF